MAGKTNQWIDKAPAAEPDPRAYMQMVFDTDQNDIILYGGDTGVASYAQDTWVFNGTTWSDISSTSGYPANTAGEYAAAFDEANKRMHVAGGVLTAGQTNATNSTYWLASGRTYYSLSAALPQGRRQGQMIYDSGSSRLIFHGGSYTVSSPTNTTWSYSGTSWGVFATGGPTVYKHAMAYDRVRDVVVVFGGDSGSGAQNQTWELDVGTTTWTQKTPSTSPSARINGQMVYQRDMGMIVLFGGWDGSSTYYQDTWVWDGNDWQQITLGTATIPSIRAGHAFCSNYKTVSGTAANLSGLTLVFGGFDSGGELDETYEFETYSHDIDTTTRAPSGVTPDSFEIDTVTPSVLEGAATSVDIDLVWYYSAPVDPPDPVDDPQTFQIVQTWRGRDEFVKYLGGLITGGYITKFKLGEGGWRESVQYNEQVGTGSGSVTVVCTFSTIPIIPSSVTITAGAQTVTDDGAGGFTGDGTGTINYKTGSATVTFDSTVSGGTPVNATYKCRGKLSSNVTQDIGYGTGSETDFSDTLTALPVHPTSVTVSDEDAQTLTDDGAGNLTGDGTGTVNYTTGAISVSFSAPPNTDFPVRVTYKFDGEAQDPDAGKTDLESEETTGLYTFEKDFSAGDIVFQGTDTSRVRITVNVGLTEANDDGYGEAPFFFEGGFFSSNDVLICYFTFPRFKKTSSVEFDKVLDLVI